MTKTLAQSGHVFVAWRAPFAERQPILHAYRPGMTLAEMVEATPGLPIDFGRRGVVMIGGHEIARRHWGRVRPKVEHTVTLHYALQGGGEGRGRKSGILGLIVGIAAIALSVFTLGGGLAFLGGAFAPGGAFGVGSIGLKLLATGISLGGSLLAAALTPPPIRPDNGRQDQKGPASIRGNVLAPGVPIPRVIGDPGRRVFPPLAAQPLVERIGDNEIAEAVFVLAGPHRISDIRLGDSGIEEAEDVEYEVREGWGDDAAIDIVRRYAVTKTPSIELSAHQVDADVQNRLENQAQPARSVPTWHSVSTSAGADKIWLHVTLPEGLHFAGTTPLTMPFRLRMRAGPGDPWINLPEIQYSSSDAREIRLAIDLVWSAAPEVVPAVPANTGWTAAYKFVAGQVAPDPASENWTADASFSAGAGADGAYAGAEGTTNVRRVTLDGFKATFHLDPGAIPPGRYEIQIKRGSAFVRSSFAKATYLYGGVARDFFHWIVTGGVAQVVLSRENTADRAYLLRASSVFDDHPVKGGATGPGLAIIAVRATNRQIENLSCLAAGYVRDWDGAGWNAWTATSNPAAHFRDVLRGPLTPDPLDSEIIDDASLVTWRQACIDAGYTVDMVCEGDPVEDVLGRIAGCGYARPRASETWGVIRDYDRSAEDPVQIFTPRNSSGLAMAKAFARLPDAFRVVYQDGEADDADDERIVWRPGREAVANPRIEEIRYEGVRLGAAAEARGRFDLGQADLRSALWSWRAPAEALRATRGDLVGIAHDVIDRQHGSGRIVDIEVEGGEIVAIVLDCEVPVYNEPDMLAVDDMLAVADMLAVGMTTGLGIRQADLTVSQHAVAGATGQRARLELATPVAVEMAEDGEPVIRLDNLAWVGSASRLQMRLVVAGIDYEADQVAVITAVPEAPQLWAA